MRAPEVPFPPIPDYIGIRMIGQGSYGDVWLVKGVTGAFRAVKIVWKDRFADIRPYEREFEGITQFAAISIREPSQLALLHVGRTEGFFYYVMELADDAVSGRDIDPDDYHPKTLRDVRGSGGRTPVTEVVGLGVSLARALATLHGNNLVHRDIKPSNIIFVGGVPKLADVGLVAVASAGLTFVGTEGFVPPEGPGALSADVFSLGKVLYEQASGLDRDQYPRLPQDLDQWPDRAALMELNEVIVRACEPNPLHRFADAGALLDELLLLQAGKSVRRLRSAERRTAMALRVAAVLAAVACVAGAGAAIERMKARHETELREQAEAQRDDLARKSIYSAGIARTQRALETGDLGHARQLLRDLLPKTGDPDLRGFEWDALWSEAQGDPAEILRPGGAPVDRIDCTSDGRYIADHSQDDRISLWDGKTHREMLQISPVARGVGFSSDGKWLVGMTPEKALRRWSVPAGSTDGSGPRGASLPALAIGTDAVLYYPYRQKGEDTGSLALWNFRENRQVWRTPLGHGPQGAPWQFFPAGGAAATPDGRLFAVALISGLKFTAAWNIALVDGRTGAITLIHPSDDRYSSLAFSRDGRRLACAYGDTADVEVLEVGTWRRVWHKSVGSGQANGLCYSTDNSLLTVAGRSGTVQILDAETGAFRSGLRGQEGTVTGMTWLPGQGAPLIGTSSGEIRLWKAIEDPQAKALALLNRKSGPGESVCVSPSGRRLASNATGHSIVILDLTLGRIEAELGPTLFPVAFSPDERQFTAVTLQGELQTWDLQPALKLKHRVDLLNPRTTAACAQIAQNGSLTVIGSNDGRLYLWDNKTEVLQAAIPAHRGDIWWAVPTPDGSRVISFGKDMTAAVWDAHSGRNLARWNETIEPDAATVSPDGSLLAIAFDDGSAKLYSLADYRLVRKIYTGAGDLRSILFTPDGKRLLLGAQNGELHIIATDDWREVALFVIPPGGLTTGEIGILDLAENPNESLVAASLTFGHTAVWCPLPK